jgi:hypothetical protein
MNDSSIPVVLMFSRCTYKYVNHGKQNHNKYNILKENTGGSIELKFT